MGKTEIVDAALGDHDQVDGTLKDLGMVAKHLTNPPLDAVADDGTADLLRDGDSTHFAAVRCAHKGYSLSTNSWGNCAAACTCAAHEDLRRALLWMGTRCDKCFNHCGFASSGSAKAL